MSDYPEHDKRSKILDQSQAIGEFLDWLGSQGVHLVVYETRSTQEPCQGTLFRMCENGRTEFGTECQQCHGTGWKTVTREGDWDWTPTSIEERLARYFDIDLTKIEAERRAMLASLRAQS